MNSLLMENAMDAEQQQHACVSRKTSSTPKRAMGFVVFRNSLVILVPATVAPGNNANARARVLQEEPGLVQVQPSCGGGGAGGLKLLPNPLLF